MDESLQTAIFTIVANIGLITTGFAVRWQRDKNIGKTREAKEEENKQQLIDTLNEHKEDSDKRIRELEIRQHTTNEIVDKQTEEIRRLNEQTKRDTQTIEILQSTVRNRDEEKIRDRQTIDDLTRRMTDMETRLDAITKDKEELAQQLQDEREGRRRDQQKYEKEIAGLSGKLAVFEDTNKGLREDIRAMVKTVQGASESAAPAPEPGESNEIQTPQEQ